MWMIFISLYCRNHHVYCDNYFSSINLFLDLQRNGIYACGTLRSNRRGFPNDLKPFVKRGLSERGESEVRQNGNLTVSVWQDSKPVTVIATNADPTRNESVQRKTKDGTTRSVPSLQAIVLYNHFMGGVDLNDQLRGYYSLRLKGRKYYKYIFFFLLDLTITNAYILCKHFTDLTVTSTKTFRAELAKALIGTYCSRKKRGRPSMQSVSKRARYMEHFPVKNTTPGKNGHRCHYCYTHCNKRRRETTWLCKACDVYLCHNGREEDCFLAHHRKIL